MTDTFLYVLRPNRLEILTEGPTDEETRTLERHVQYLQELLASDVVTLFGRTQTTTPDTMGLVILHARDESAARALMQSDPAVVDGLMSATLYPYRIAGMRATSRDA